MTISVQPKHYARLRRRLEATLIDTILIAVAFFGAATFMSSTDVSPFVKIVFVLAPIFLLEPFLIAMTGATIGQRLRALRVENIEDGSNLSILRSVIRFVAKALVGLISMIMILMTSRNQALHDKVTGSVVVISDVTKVSEHELSEDKSSYDPNMRYPSAGRRTVIILSYVCLSFLLYALVLEWQLPDACLESDTCTETETAIGELSAVGWLIAVVILIVQGCRSQLWGCKPHKIT